MRHMAFAKRDKTYIVTRMNGARDIPVQPRKRHSLAYWVRLGGWAALAIAVLLIAGFIAFSGLIYDALLPSPAAKPEFPKP
jgi:fructose-specific phosphotransferase system IIC component